VLLLWLFFKLNFDFLKLFLKHAKKSVFKFDGNLLNSETGLFVQALDYRGADDLPEHTFLQGYYF